MKKTLTKIVALLAVLTVMMTMVSIPAVAEAPTATAWLLYFASPSWWPQHKEMNQPASETGVEATNPIITGPGKYTAALKFNWNDASGALQFNLVLDNAQEAFPGYYLDITDIRVNGKSLEIKDNLYGEFHDNKKAGFAPIYNSYWSATEGPDLNTMSAFDGTIDTETHQIINPDDIKAGKTIEVDFIFAKNPGEVPADLGEVPDTYMGLVPVEPAAVIIPDSVDTSNAATASIQFLSNYWLKVDGKNIAGDSVKLTGEGNYSLAINFVDQGGWTHSHDATTPNRLYVQVENPAGTAVDGMYVGITELRIDNKVIDLDGTIAYGRIGYDDSNFKLFTKDDYYAVLYDQYQSENAHNTAAGMGLTTWDGSEGSINAFDPSVLTNFNTLEIDFFVTAQKGVKPTGNVIADPKPQIIYNDPVWYNNCTVGLAGLSLKELRIEDDWHNVVPVDLTKNAYYVFPLVGAEAYHVGNALVTVNNGVVYVTCDYVDGYFNEHRQSIKWFTSRDQISKAEIVDLKGGYKCGDVVSIENDLGGATMAYLSINNKASFRTPINDYLQDLPRYYRNLDQWIAYRAELKKLAVYKPAALPVTAEDAVK